jgi:hypothetical protein
VARGWRAFGVYEPRVVRPWLYVTRDHGDGNPVTRVMGDSRSRVMSDPVTMVTLEIWVMEKTRVNRPDDPVTR